MCLYTKSHQLVHTLITIDMMCEVNGTIYLPTLLLLTQAQEKRNVAVNNDQFRRPPSCLLHKKGSTFTNTSIAKTTCKNASFTKKDNN